MHKKAAAVLICSVLLTACARPVLPVIVEPPRTPEPPAALVKSDATRESTLYSQKASDWQSRVQSYLQRVAAWSAKVQAAWQEAPR